MTNSSKTDPDFIVPGAASAPLKDLKELLELFHLKHTAQTYEILAKEAAHNNWSHLAFLSHLLSQEDALRHQRIVETRLKESKIPVLKTIADFDWSHPSSIPRPLILNAFRLQFIKNKENFILVGPSGVGKSHIAQALGFAACQSEIKTLWTTAADLVNTLTAAKADHSLGRTIRTYLAPKLLVIDELGFLPMDKDGSDLFFQIISHRYEQGSVVLTTNRAFRDWGKIFHDTTVATAILDRLAHHAEVAKIEGPSYRVKNRKDKQTQSAGE